MTVKCIRCEDRFEKFGDICGCRIIDELRVKIKELQSLILSQSLVIEEKDKVLKEFEFCIYLENDEKPVFVCMFCNRSKIHGHKDDCVYSKVLSLSSSSDMGKRVVETLKFYGSSENGDFYLSQGKWPEYHRKARELLRIINGVSGQEE